MKIGIMGGTFNPIHNGHLAVASYAMDICGLEKVLFITGAVPPHKDFKIPDANIRHKMVCVAIEKYDGFYPCDYEIKKGGLSYTADTVEYLKSKYSENEWYFIMGADSLRDFHTWHEPQRITRFCSIIAYPRIGVDIYSAKADAEKKCGANVELIGAPIMQISSTEIRSRVKSGKCIDFFVPDSVLRIIKEEDIYV